jgi:hypothetical protein
MPDSIDPPDSHDGQLINANPVVSCHFTLAPDFSVEDLQKAAIETAKAFNKAAGLLLAEGKISIGSSAGQPLLGAIANLEQFCIIVQQIRQQALAQSGLVGAVPVPPRGPVRMN